MGVLGDGGSWGQGFLGMGVLGDGGSWGQGFLGMGVLGDGGSWGQGFLGMGVLWDGVLGDGCIKIFMLLKPPMTGLFLRTAVLRYYYIRAINYWLIVLRLTLFCSFLWFFPQFLVVFAVAYIQETVFI